MKKMILLSFTALAFAACSGSSTKSETTESKDSVQTFTLDTMKLKSGETFYQCEMNPEVLSDKPGKCPKCGMELEKLAKK